MWESALWMNNPHINTFHPVDEKSHERQMTSVCVCVYWAFAPRWSFCYRGNTRLMPSFSGLCHFDEMMQLFITLINISVQEMCFKLSALITLCHSCQHNYFSPAVCCASWQTHSSDAQSWLDEARLQSL